MDKRNTCSLYYAALFTHGQASSSFFNIQNNWKIIYMLHYIILYYFMLYYIIWISIKNKIFISIYIYIYIYINKQNKFNTYSTKSIQVTKFAFHQELWCDVSVINSETSPLTLCFSLSTNRSFYCVLGSEKPLIMIGAHAKLHFRSTF